MPHEIVTRRPASEADVTQTVWDIAEALGHLIRLSADILGGVDSAPLRSVLSRMENRASEVGRGDLASVLAEAHRLLRARADRAVRERRISSDELNDPGAATG